MLFHGDQACKHAKNGKPCSSHGNQSSSDEFESCAVVLFGESSEHLFTISNTFFTDHTAQGVLNLDSSIQYFAERFNNRQARGPPKLI